MLKYKINAINVFKQIKTDNCGVLKLTLQSISGQ